MANILAVDDEEDVRALLQAALARDGHTVKTLASGAAVTPEACRWADCILLDVMMPDLDGLALGAVIREDDPDAVIIYFTSSPDYAVDSFSVQASGYLLKPIERATLFAQLDRVLNKLSWEQGVLTMKTRDRVSLIRPSDIRYVEGTNHTAIFYLSRERTVTATKRGCFHEAVAPLLNDERFLRVGTSFLVNMLYVDSMEQGCFLMQEGGKILIPRLKRSEVRDRFLDFSLRRGLNL